MAGNNPYIKDAPPTPAKKTFKITLVNEGKTVEIDPSRIPFQSTGLPGSIMDLLMGAAKVEVDHACGGVCACATCHVYIRKGLKTCSSPTDAELDMLDLAPDLRPDSRLACQCVPTGDEDIEVEIPAWNRNLAREGK